MDTQEPRPPRKRNVLISSFSRINGKVKRYLGIKKERAKTTSESSASTVEGRPHLEQGPQNETENASQSSGGFVPKQTSGSHENERNDTKEQNELANLEGSPCEEGKSYEAEEVHMNDLRIMLDSSTPGLHGGEKVPSDGGNPGELERHSSTISSSSIHSIPNEDECRQTRVMSHGTGHAVLSQVLPESERFELLLHTISPTEKAFFVSQASRSSDIAAPGMSIVYGSLEFLIKMLVGSRGEAYWDVFLLCFNQFTSIQGVLDILQEYLRGADLRLSSERELVSSERELSIIIPEDEGTLALITRPKMSKTDQVEFDEPDPKELTIDSIIDIESNEEESDVVHPDAKKKETLEHVLEDLGFNIDVETRRENAKRFLAYWLHYGKDKFTSQQLELSQKLLVEEPPIQESPGEEICSGDDVDVEETDHFVYEAPKERILRKTSSESDSHSHEAEGGTQKCKSARSMSDQSADSPNSVYPNKFHASVTETSSGSLKSSEKKFVTTRSPSVNRLFSPGSSKLKATQRSRSRSHGWKKGGLDPSTPTSEITLNQFKPEQVAQCLTYMLFKNTYQHIEPSDLVTSEARDNSKVIQRMIHTFDLYAWWPLSWILNRNIEVVERVERVIFFLDVATECRRLNNYHTFFGIVAGLSQPLMQWLWDFLKDKDRFRLDHLKRAVKTKGDYLVYRADLSKCSNRSHIPFLGLTTKLLFPLEHNIPYRSADQPHMINFMRCVSTHSTINDFLKGQRFGYVVEKRTSPTHMRRMSKPGESSSSSLNSQPTRRLSAMSTPTVARKPASSSASSTSAGVTIVESSSGWSSPREFSSTAPTISTQLDLGAIGTKSRGGSVTSAASLAPQQHVHIHVDRKLVALIEHGMRRAKSKERLEKISQKLKKRLCEDLVETLENSGFM